MAGATREWKRNTLSISETKKASNHDVRRQADFRNQAFLNRFITELGKLPPKRTTRLQRKTHRHLCRTIKARARGCCPFLPSSLSCMGDVRALTCTPFTTWGISCCTHAMLPA